MLHDTQRPTPPSPSAPSPADDPAPWPIVRGAAAVAALAVVFIVATVDGVGATVMWAAAALGLIAAAVGIMVVHERTPAARERRKERAAGQPRSHRLHLRRHR